VNHSGVPSEWTQLASTATRADAPTVIHIPAVYHTTMTVDWNLVNASGFRVELSSGGTAEYNLDDVKPYSVYKLREERIDKNSPQAHADLD